MAKNIFNIISNTLLGGTSGNDTIENFGDNVTISGGKGNDSLNLLFYAKNNVIRYASGDGNDTIDGFDSDDILHITKGSYTVKTDGDDVIVTVGKGKIILKDAVGEEISIKNSSGKVTTKTYGSSSANTAELFEENNFATADNISSITKNNLTPTALEKISATNFENLTTENNLITFSGK